MRVINLAVNDIEIISMALIDNATIGHLNRVEYKMAWNILERIYETNRLSMSDLTLIYDSLHRYATRYDCEHVEVRECKRVYKMIMEACSNGHYTV
ncbi:hypothetical protein [Clostridium algidicarnis]|uniref:hypothetical protein n=1 Tax=Clostridium algidicarnis TaxID=37659 RepID=UPI001C0D5D4C|nr:hypothetical protein [Clostridium algidicarnis]MBU3209766.1 hypothetical protein [Clostridium algidicarnis]